jgi:hypothetical protein
MPKDLEPRIVPQGPFEMENFMLLALFTLDSLPLGVRLYSHSRGNKKIFFMSENLFISRVALLLLLLLLELACELLVV